MNTLKATMIVPIYQNDGRRQPPEVFATLESRLLDDFGGFTKFPCEGNWLDEDGSWVEDMGVAYTITRMPCVLHPTEEGFVARLMVIAKDTASEAHQKCIYLDFVQAKAFLVEPWKGEAHAKGSTPAVGDAQPPT